MPTPDPPMRSDRRSTGDRSEVRWQARRTVPATSPQASQRSDRWSEIIGGFTTLMSNHWEKKENKSRVHDFSRDVKDVYCACLKPTVDGGLLSADRGEHVFVPVLSWPVPRLRSPCLADICHSLEQCSGDIKLAKYLGTFVLLCPALSLVCG